MRSLRCLRLTGVLLLVLSGGATPVTAQSVLATWGLGATVDPLDGRGRGLGSVGPGLFGTGVIPGDPGASLDLRVPTIAVSMQSSWLQVEQDAGSSSLSGSRFPAMGLAYPVRDWGVLTVTYGGVLDQRWTLVSERQLNLGGSAETSVTDRFVSDGGVAAARVGFARRVTPNLGVALAVGSFTGNIVRSYTRSFDFSDGGVVPAPFQSAGRWGYSGVTATAGLVFDVSDIVRAGATVTLSGSLKANPSGVDGETKTYDMPVEFRGGISGALGAGTSLVLSASYADWSGAWSSPGGETTAGAAVSLGAGLEWASLSIAGRPWPLRLGWRRTELPFRRDDADPVESALVGGFGLQLAGAGDIPLAQIDLGVERGTRSAGSLQEDFWRSTVSLRLAGF